MIQIENFDGNTLLTINDFTKKPDKYSVYIRKNLILSQEKEREKEKVKKL